MGEQVVPTAAGLRLRHGRAQSAIVGASLVDDHSGQLGRLSAQATANDGGLPHGESAEASAHAAREREAASVGATVGRLGAAVRSEQQQAATAAAAPRAPGGA